MIAVHCVHVGLLLLPAAATMKTNQSGPKYSLDNDDDDQLGPSALPLTDMDTFLTVSDDYHKLYLSQTP